MFAIGDRVVYPLHGGAIVKDIESKNINGSNFDYYILQMLFENMTVSVPVLSAEKLGLRYIGDESLLDKVAATLHETPDVQTYKSISWNRRFQLYMEQIKSGNIENVARIYKILATLEAGKKISVGERRLFNSTKQILQSEIMLILNYDLKQAAEWLDKETGLQ